MDRFIFVLSLNGVLEEMIEDTHFMFTLGRTSRLSTLSPLRPLGDFVHGQRRSSRVAKLI